MFRAWTGPTRTGVQSSTWTRWTGSGQVRARGVSHLTLLTITEGSSPLPLKEKVPAKVLGGLGGKSLDILTESEENLNTEIEMINSSSRALESLRNISEPSFRYVTPSIELTPDPEEGYSSQGPGSRSRSLTPATCLQESKVRRTTFPLLCSRPGSARKKSFLSSEDLQRTSANNSSSCNLQTIGKREVFITVMNSKKFIIKSFRHCIDFLDQNIYMRS